MKISEENSRSNSKLITYSKCKENGVIKSEKGVTLISVIIYIIGMLIMATVIGTITIYFYNNLINASEISKLSIEYGKFNMFFLEDVKQQGNKVVNIDTNTGLIQFSNGSSYYYKNECIYRNNVKICDRIQTFEMQYQNVNTKLIIKILMQVEDRSYTTSYVVGIGY